MEVWLLKLFLEFGLSNKYINISKSLARALFPFLLTMMFMPGRVNTYKEFVFAYKSTAKKILFICVEK